MAGGTATTRIGGPTRAHGNTVARNDVGIVVRGSASGVTIEDNSIGTRPGGVSDRFSDGRTTGNFVGIWIFESDGHVVRNNTISGNNPDKGLFGVIDLIPQSSVLHPAAIRMEEQSSSNRIENNRIGTDQAGQIALPNFGYGMHLMPNGANRVAVT